MPDLRGVGPSPQHPDSAPGVDLGTYRSTQDLVLRRLSRVALELHLAIRADVQDAHHVVAALEELDEAIRFIQASVFATVSEPVASTPLVAELDIHQTTASLLRVSGAVDLACEEASNPPAPQLLEASRALHQALLALRDWAYVDWGGDTGLVTEDPEAPSPKDQGS